jgi:hypothetical protein
MAVMWTTAQREHVEDRLAARPLGASHWCVALAREILPIARERDIAARGLVIRPAFGLVRYPTMRSRNRAAPPWFHHVTVAVDGHGVDALTGANGTDLAAYLTTHFENTPGDLCFDERDANLEDPCL